MTRCKDIRIGIFVCTVTWTQTISTTKWGRLCIPMPFCSPPPVARTFCPVTLGWRVVISPWFPLLPSIHLDFASRIVRDKLVYCGDLVAIGYQLIIYSNRHTNSKFIDEISMWKQYSTQYGMWFNMYCYSTLHTNELQIFRCVQGRLQTGTRFLDLAGAFKRKF